jgi:hypothetical protein
MTPRKDRDQLPSPATLQAVEDAGRRFAAAQVERDDARDALRAAVRAGYREGATEVELAARAGVNRMTVRDWLGKDPFRTRRKSARVAADAGD